MKHLALRARRMHAPGPYTATGLGDRIHSCILGWVLGPPVTIHLTADKYQGGQFGNKPESWAEIISLFPAGSLQVQAHSVTPQTEQEWLEYLRSYSPVTYRYGDAPGDYEPGAIDIAPLLREILRLEAEPQDIELPERFVTVQWDANAKSRTIPVRQRAEILARYEGYTPVVVGGESKDERLRWSLKHIAYAMSRAALHIGVDSAFFHLAQLYMPWERIHLYALGIPGHHVLRARNNGAVLNRYL